MKKLVVSVVMSVACLSFNANAALQGAKNYKFVGDTEFAGLCEAVINDDLGQFKKSVAKQAGAMGSSKARTLEVLLNDNNVQCGGQGLVAFSQARSANNVLNYLSQANVEAEQKAKFKFVGDTAYAKFCKAAVTNNVDLFKRALAAQVGSLASSKQQVLDMVLDAKNVSCAGQGLAEFSESRQASDVVNFINSVK